MTPSHFTCSDVIYSVDLIENILIIPGYSNQSNSSVYIHPDSMQLQLIIFTGNSILFLCQRGDCIMTIICIFSLFIE